MNLFNNIIIGGACDWVFKKWMHSLLFPQTLLTVTYIKISAAKTFLGAPVGKGCKRLIINFKLLIFFGFL